MLTLLSVAALGFALVGMVGGIWLLVEAFKMSMAEGFLTLCVPCYAFYFAFAKLQSPQKNLIIGLWLTGMIGNIVLQGIIAAMGGGQPGMIGR